MPHHDRASILSSLKAYLEELKESGVDGLPEELCFSDTSASLTQVAEPPVFKSGMQTEQQTEQLHETLLTIKKNLGDCHRCNLSKNRKNIVFGNGSDTARIVFVGEGPGAEEDASGEPFVGEAGAILTRIITAMGLTRNGVYICNVVKCRPPENRNPEPDEIAACSPFLERQLKVIKPDVIVALGRFASETLLSTKEPITRLRGKFHDYHGTPLMPTFHPSYLLRNKANKVLFWDVWNDMVQVLKLVGLPVPEKSKK